MTHTAQRNQGATVYVADLDLQVNEGILWELMLQAGPVVNVHIPRDKLTRNHMNYGFVEFQSELDADYAIKVMNMTKLYGKPIRLNKAERGNQAVDAGANLFVGNLDSDVDEALLWETFSRFGILIAPPKIMRDESNSSRGFAFVNYDSFEGADAAIEQMNSQYLCGRPISVTYAFKKDSKTERHGSMAERVLAANNPLRDPRNTVAARRGGPAPSSIPPPPMPAPPMLPMVPMPPGPPPPGGFMPPPPFFAENMAMMPPPPPFMPQWGQ